jgi:maleate isomerase
MEACGFTIKAMKGLQILDPFEASVHDADSAYRLGREVIKEAGQADAILISCGTYRTFEILPYLEMDTRTPVVSSNQATLWRALRAVGLPDIIPNLGKLWTVA